MISVFVPGGEAFIDATQEFINTKDTTLQLEHSLISLRKWESKWHIPFLGEGSKTAEQTLDYIRCMTLNQNVDPNVYRFLTDVQIKEITKYIEDPQTATWFGDPPKKEGAAPKKKEVITAEIIYYWMISLQIPVEFQKWHLNSLLTLIRVINIKNTPDKKMSAKEAARQRSALNAARRAKQHSRG